MPPAQRPQSSFPCYSPESSDSALPCPRRSAASSKHDSAPVPDVPLEHRHRRVTAPAQGPAARPAPRNNSRLLARRNRGPSPRSEEHTSELQSHLNLVCRLLLEKKKNKKPPPRPHPPANTTKH